MGILSGTPRDVLLGLINAANSNLPVPVSESNLYFGKPIAGSDGISTTLPATGTLGADYEGYVNFTYQRIDLTKAYSGIVPTVRAIGASTLVAMLPMLSEYLGLPLTAEDVIDTNIANVNPGEQVNIKISASAVSLGYVGFFTIKFIRLRPSLATLITNRDLAILNQIIDVALGVNAVALMTWGFDFTPYKDRLKLNGTTWKNITDQQAVMVDFGFNDWPVPMVGAVSDKPTSAVTTANPKYDRVIIQKGVSTLGYFGDAYFHYNLSS